MRRSLVGMVLAIVLLGILFPMAWPARFSASYARLFEAVFSPPWMHVLTHAALFAVLAGLVWPLSGRLIRGEGWSTLLVRVLATLGLVLVVGLLQEGFQSLVKGRALGAWDDRRDLAVDLVGGLAGLLLAQLWHGYRARRARSAP